MLLGKDQHGRAPKRGPWSLSARLQIDSSLEKSTAERPFGKGGSTTDDLPQSDEQLCDRVRFSGCFGLHLDNETEKHEQISMNGNCPKTVNCEDEMGQFCTLFTAHALEH